MAVHTCNSRTWGSLMQEDCHEFEVRLCYAVSTKPARARKQNSFRTTAPAVKLG